MRVKARNQRGEQHKKRQKDGMELRAAALDAAVNGIVITDRNANIIWVNPAFSRLTGYSAQEAIGATTRLLKSGKQDEGFYRNLWQSVLSGNVWQGELINRRKDGGLYEEEQTITPVRGRSGEITHFIAIKQDITERKNLERELGKYRQDLEKLVEQKTIELENLNRFLKSVVENIPNMIFIKDAKELKFVRFNKAGEELLGYSRADLIGKNDYDFFPKSEADFFVEKDRLTLGSGQIVDIPEEPIQTRLKGQRFLHTKKITLSDEKGRPEFLLGISEDITEKKQAAEVQRKLEQEINARKEAEKNVLLRDDFISIAAHELRTPLTTFSMQIQLLTKFLPEIETPKVQKYVVMMQNSKQQLDRLTKLVENLLDVARASSGRLIIERTEVDLTEVVHRVAKSYEAELAKSKSTLRLHLESSVLGMWDSVRIEQVVENLLSNATKYGAGKPIEISTKVEGTMAVLAVRDEGIGIAKEDQTKIFNRFERATSIKSFAGLGLGLFITHQIVIAHGGRIRLESELGKGSTFIVELPLQ